jgi:hypothetical protein
LKANRDFCCFSRAIFCGETSFHHADILITATVKKASVIRLKFFIVGSVEEINKGSPKNCPYANKII